MINLFDRSRRYLKLAVILFVALLVSLGVVTVIGWRIPWFALAWWQAPSPQQIGMLRWDQQGLPLSVNIRDENGAEAKELSDVAFDGYRLWVTYSQSNEETNEKKGFVVSYDPLTGQWGEQIEVGKNPRGVVFDGQNIWVANNGDSTVSCIPIVREWDPTMPYPGEPFTRTLASSSDAYYMAFDGEHIWVTARDDNSLWRLPAGSCSPATDNPDMQITKVLEVGDSDVSYTSTTNDNKIDLNKPFGIIFDGTYIWVANRGSNIVMRLNPDDCNGDTCTETLIMKVGNATSHPSNLAYDGTYVWVTLNGTEPGQVARIHARTGQLIGQPIFSQPITLPSPILTDDPCLDEPKEIDGIAFDGIYIWVASNNGCVYQLRAADVSLISQFKVVFETNGEGKERTTTPEPRSRIAFDGTYIWIIITDGTKSSFTRR